MKITTLYRSTRKKTLKQAHHHGEKRRRFAEDYLVLTRNRFGNKETFGGRTLTPIKRIFQR